MRLGVSAALLDGKLIETDLEITDGRVTALRPAASGRRIAIPGLVDLQVNGYAGIDFMAADADGHRVAARALLRTGTTAYLVTIVSAEAEEMVRAIRSAGVAQAARGTLGLAASSLAEICGVHVEGPFLSVGRRGVHPAEVLRDPDRELATRFLDAGPVRIVTLAPERPGALDLIEFLVGRGVVVSCGHTDATAAEAGAAFDSGASTVTHLFNGMRPLHHREPGIVGLALDRADVTIQVILDGIHLAPEVERLVWRVAAGRLVVVTDAVPPAGLPDGTYTLGPTTITVMGGIPTGPSGQLSGGMGTLLESARRLIARGAGMPEAVGSVTELPARLIGRRDIGRLAIGASADLLIVDETLELFDVFKDGVPLE